MRIRWLGHVKRMQISTERTFYRSEKKENTQAEMVTEHERTGII